MTASALLRRYAELFHAAIDGGQAVTSPLGAWLLAALVAPAATDAVRERLADALGTDAATAASMAASMLANPHPAVASALAAWANPSLVNGSYATWAGSLPPCVAQGPIPAQASVDAWAAAHTNGMIDTFPIVLDSLTALVLASAVTTAISWAEPYMLRPAVELGGRFAAGMSNCLYGTGWICNTDSAGLVGVHEKMSSNGLHTISVIGDETVPASLVHAAALELIGNVYPQHADLAALPLGDGPAWTLTEREGFADSVQVLLPAWRSDGPSRDIAAAPGVREALATLATLVVEPESVKARQKVVAEYTRVGFRAAAVTAFGVRLGMPPPQRKLVREATVRFNRPYAVVAYTTNTAPGTSRGWGSVDLEVPAWDMIPVFSAWVTDPIDTLD